MFFYQTYVFAFNISRRENVVFPRTVNLFSKLRVCECLFANSLAYNFVILIVILAHFTKSGLF